MLDSARDIVSLQAAAGQVDRFGARAARLGQMAALGLPVPPGLALSFHAVRALFDGDRLTDLDLGGILALRSSPQNPDWGGPGSFLNIGMTEESLPGLIEEIGEAQALEIYARAIQSYGVRIGGIEPEAFDTLSYDRVKLHNGLSVAALRALVEDSLQLYRDELDEDYPQCSESQLAGAMRAFARAWDAPSAKILRRAKGAPEEAGLGLVLQRMAFGIGAAPSGSGRMQWVDGSTGEASVIGRFVPDRQGLEGSTGVNAPRFAARAEAQAAGQTEATLEDLAPDAFAALESHAAALRAAVGDEMSLSFTLSGGRLAVTDCAPVRRGARAAVRIAVDLAEAGVIDRTDALRRIAPQSLVDMLHAQIAPGVRRDVVLTALPASPGAAVGKIVFTPEAAMTAAAQEENVILVRLETTPEDTRGVQAAAGVLTIRGGMSSHAAVIARGLGKPCVVGARDLVLDGKARAVRTPDGRVFAEGSVIAIDGSSGEVMAGAPEMIPAATSGALDTLLGWADEVRRIGVRANADTVVDARVARQFKVDGIGLCRTEHLFLDDDSLSLVRQMILAGDAAERQRALDRILVRHRADLTTLFEEMAGLPVTIRLLDPPLHEFLPHSASEFTKLARAMDLPVEVLVDRAAGLNEVNPMLGLRGVRLGITAPEIYDMQARAILEAALEAGRKTGRQVTPEIMVPLVSTMKEAEIVRARVEAVATAVHNESGDLPVYKYGIMVETPRGALRADDLARTSAFLSFGTNDLTQMAYGMSRDDAGRFMRAYVNSGVFEEDPFHTLDIAGVGELIRIAVERGRAANPELTVGMCGEHGGDPASIAFCVAEGFDYVSCSPYRVPIARLAAAHASLPPATLPAD